MSFLLIKSEQTMALIRRYDKIKINQKHQFIIHFILEFSKGNIIINPQFS